MARKKEITVFWDNHVLDGCSYFDGHRRGQAGDSACARDDV